MSDVDIECNVFIFITVFEAEISLPVLIVFTQHLRIRSNERFILFQLLLFPEGTNLTAKTKSRSDAFAEKYGLPKYNYVLHPRTTGFTFLAQHMKNSKFTSYDLTEIL
jgi:hypothetical protein